MIVRNLFVVLGLFLMANSIKGQRTFYSDGFSPVLYSAITPGQGVPPEEFVFSDTPRLLPQQELGPPQIVFGNSFGNFFSFLSKYFPTVSHASIGRPGRPFQDRPYRPGVGIG